MTHGKRTGLALGAALGLAWGGLLLSVPNAEAYGRRGHVVVHGFRPFFGAYFGPYFGPYFGFGFGPYFGPYFSPYWAGYPGYYGYYGPSGGPDMAVAAMTGWGALDLNVKPNQAEVWVDGKYMGEAREFDGYPAYLWLEKGPHRLQIYKGGYASFDEEINVERGRKRDLKVRLEKGDSRPPGTKPSDEQKDNEPRREDKDTD